MELLYQGPAANLHRWRVRKGQMVTATSVLCTLLSPSEGGADRRFVSEHSGRILELAKEEGDSINHGEVLLRFEVCKHDIVIKDLCAECGVNLRACDGMPGERKEVANASVAMVHNIPELYVSEEKANELADEDTQRLLANRKLVLLIDLDQTLIHTTCEDVPPNLKDVHHFQLPCPGGGSPFYHTKLRPGTEAFLQAMSKLFELHIVTFGNRLYAHTIAGLLDPQHKFFAHRILSRDEAFNPLTKTANLKSLFPRGDSMVCIIDDRAEVWSFSNHLIHVNPYKYFRGTEDINLPGDNGARMRSARELKGNRKPRTGPQSEANTRPEAGDKETSEEALQAADEAPEEGSEAGPEVEQEVAPEVEQEVAPEVEQEVAPEVEQEVAPEVEQEVAPEVEQEVRDEEAEVAPEVSEVGAEAGPEAMEVGLEEPEVDQEQPEVEPEASEGAEAEALAQDGVEEVAAGCSGAQEAVVDSSCAPPKRQSEAASAGEADCVTSATEAEAAMAATSGASDEAELVDSTVPDDDKEPGEACSSANRVLASAASTSDAVDSTTEGDPWVDRDDYLVYLQQMLRRVHTTFYAAYDAAIAANGLEGAQLPDLKAIIPELRRATLRHVRLVFSGLVPLGFAPNQSGAFHLARHLGAEVQPDLVTSSRQRTHYVVASRAGTKKVSMARAHHIRVVSPHWLWQCYFRWQRASGREFKLRKDYDPESFDFNDRKRPLPPWTGEAESSAAAGTSLENGGGGRPSKRRRVGPNGAAEEAAPVASTSAGASVRKPGAASLEIARNPLMQMSPEDAFNMRGEVDEEMRSLGEEDSEEDDEEDDEEDGGRRRTRRERRRALAEEGELSTGSSASSSSLEPVPKVKARRSRLDDDSSAESSDEGSLSGDYPKGWRPRRPGGSRSVSSEEVDREYRTCPEGYDYADAEYTRRVLRDDISSTEESGASGGELTDEDECMDALRAFI